MVQLEVVINLSECQLTSLLVANLKFKQLRTAFHNVLKDVVCLDLVSMSGACNNSALKIVQLRVLSLYISDDNLYALERRSRNIIVLSVSEQKL
jgi:hypothetical protein